MDKQVIKLEKSYFKNLEKQKELERKASFIKEKKRQQALKIHNLKYHTA